MPGKRADLPAQDAEDQVTLDLTEADISAFIRGLIPPRRQEGEKSAPELARENGITVHCMETILLDAVKAGQIEWRWGVVNGSRGKLYRMKA